MRWKQMSHGKWRSKTKKHLQLLSFHDRISKIFLPIRTTGTPMHLNQSTEHISLQDCQGQPDIILVASGSEVATLVEGAALLRKDNLNVRIVSAPSEGIFRDEHEFYRKSIIPDNVPVFGLTAGLSVTLQGLVGPKGKVWGVNSFGYSAPYKVLDEKFGFTAENVYRQVKDYLAQYKK